MVQRTDFGDMACSIARTLDIAGEPWSPLIIRDVWAGIRRFDELQRDLGISRKVLTERLAWLVGHGMLERRQYSDRPPRYEYVLTPKGLEFTEVLMVIRTWGDRWTAGEAGPPTLLRHHACGEHVDAEVRCSHCGELLRGDEVDVEDGPGARS